MTTNNFDALKSIFDRYVDILHDLYGFYIDMTQGFRFYREHLLKNLLLESKSLSTKSSNVIVSNSSPDDPDALILNVSSINTICERNQTEGTNVARARDHILTMILEHLNHDIRHAIANLLGCKESNDITADIFGDVNKIRNDILHSRGKADRSTKGIIIKFQKGDRIVITQEIFDTIFTEIFNYFNKLSLEVTGKIMYLDRSLHQEAKKVHISIQHKCVIPEPSK